MIEAANIFVSDPESYARRGGDKSLGEAGKETMVDGSFLVAGNIWMKC